MTAALLQWYRRHRRDLPWRRQQDPYRIWVSEVMLQQTRVDTVIPYYNRWIERFPTVSDLAAAPEDEVLKHWEGLGYYSRARNLHAAAREVVARYGGSVPDDPAAFAALKGVGAYTAGAVMSIAYGRPLPAVDGNVLRVMARLYNLEDNIAHPATRKRIETLVAGLIPPDAAADFNQALMELGALVCVPGTPRCGDCPVATHCAGRAAGRAQALPVKTRKAPPKPVLVVAGVVRDGGRVLLARRPDQGLLAGLWEFPSFELTPADPPEAALARGLAGRFGLEVVVGGLIATVDHTFSHRRWRLLAFGCRLTEASPRPRDRDGLRWVEQAELAGFALPGVFHKVAGSL